MNGLKRLLNSISAAGWIIYFPFMLLLNESLLLCIPAVILIFIFNNRDKNYAKYIFWAFGGLVIGYFVFSIPYVAGTKVESAIKVGIPSLILIVYLFELYRNRPKPVYKSTITTNHRHFNGNSYVPPTFSNSYLTTSHDYSYSSDSTITTGLSAWQIEADAKSAKERSDRDAKSQKIRELESLQAWCNFHNSDGSSDLLNHETRCIQDKLEKLRDW